MPKNFEWIVILVVVLLLFGRKLPELARSLGSSAKEFRKGIEEGASDDSSGDASGDNHSGDSEKSTPTEN